MLGSLTFYRRMLNENVFSSPSVLALARGSNRKLDAVKEETERKLPTIGHAIAGVMAGGTVSFIAAPVEHIKARLQVQYAADKSQRLYSGPIDCGKKIVRRNLPHTLISHTDPVLAASPRHRWHLPRPLSYSPFPLILFLLVGILRPLHPLLLDFNQSVHARHQFLGWRSLSPDLLAHLLSFGCRQAADHDRSLGRSVERWRKTILEVERCRKGDIEEGRSTGVLERVCAMFSASISSECCCPGCI